MESTFATMESSTTTHVPPTATHPINSTSLESKLELQKRIKHLRRQIEYKRQSSSSAELNEKSSKSSMRGEGHEERIQKVSSSLSFEVSREMSDECDVSKASVGEEESEKLDSGSNTTSSYCDDNETATTSKVATPSPGAMLRDFDEVDKNRERFQAQKEADLLMEIYEEETVKFHRARRSKSNFSMIKIATGLDEDVEIDGDRKGETTHTSTRAPRRYSFLTMFDNQPLEQSNEPVKSTPGFFSRFTKGVNVNKDNEEHNNARRTRGISPFW